MKFGMGQAVARVEDPRFLTGRGKYTDDVEFARQTHMYVVRSPHASAEIRRIDVSKAKAAPGVVLVLTGADAEAKGIKGLPPAHLPPDFPIHPKFAPERPLLCAKTVRCIGDPVAAVVAETLDQARDAAELITVDYAPKPVVASAEKAAQPGAPKVWPEMEGNVWLEMRLPPVPAALEAIDNALKGAHHVTKLKLYNNRLSTNSMETRGCVAAPHQLQDKITLYTSSQFPHKVREVIARDVLHFPETQLQVVSGDVGGGFGLKGELYVEEPLSVWAARESGRPVRWMPDRTEAMVSDAHGRDLVATAEMGFDQDGRIVAMRVDNIFNLGAYLLGNGVVTPLLGTMMLTHAYDFPAIDVRTRMVFSHTTPTTPYRGAGRPEANYTVDRLIDAAAAEMGIDPAELRRKNLIPPSKMPYQTKLMHKYDCGDFVKVMDKAIQVADWKGFEKRREESKSQGKLRGIGLTYYIEACGIFNERMELRFDPTGNVSIIAGTHSHGQGHETAFAQLVSGWLGIDMEKIRLIQGDTDQVGFGRGTYGSRSLSVGGSALKMAADGVIEKGRRWAAHLLEAAETDIEFKDGMFAVAGTDKRIPLAKVVELSFVPMGMPIHLGVGIEAVGHSDAPSTFPNGCMICEVEIDPDTGKVDIDRFTAVNDVGLTVNPLLLAGQVHGGVAQGVGQALMENVAFDPDSGQLLTGSFMDYCMPRADDVPNFTIDELPTPTKTNPLGVKGAGEAGTVGATPVVINAILNALRPLGVKDIEMPATPHKVWQAIHAAR
ncbi:MAG TPA: xanthine dehydrogenase family protein molybdopterin-binding subunit [Alphaproteobacteria bacterium]